LCFTTHIKTSNKLKSLIKSLEAVNPGSLEAVNPGSLEAVNPGSLEAWKL